jgi:uncharacterized protein YjiS (DUF1127 family)
MAEIRIDAIDPATMALWRTVAKIARALQEEQERWCLVGGLMVALYAIQAGEIQRPTTDIDLLGDARQRPSGTQWVSDRLRDLGAARHEIGGLEGEKGFRFELDGQVVDVLAPDGLARPALTGAQLQSMQIPGGSQALRRTETVAIVVDGQRAELRRPTLPAAILLKARSLAVHSRPDDQREDLITLLGLMSDPRSALAELAASERRWLRDAQTRLDLQDRDLDATIDPTRLRIARAAYARLIA